MAAKLVIIAGLPGGGAELLYSLFRSQPGVADCPAAQALTPLLHMGYFANVFKAPYDHVLAVDAQRLFVDALPGTEDDYVAACRAYCTTLYECAARGAQAVADAGPDYARLLPSIRRILPAAHIVLVVSNPVLSIAAALHNDEYRPGLPHAKLFRTSLRALAAHRREPSIYTLAYEALRERPEETLRALGIALGLDWSGAQAQYDATIAAKASDDALAADLARDAALRARVQRVLAELPPRDLAALGYPRETCWRPVEARLDHRVGSMPLRRARRAARDGLTGLCRWVVAKFAPLRNVVTKAKLATDVLLRE